MSAIENFINTSIVKEVGNGLDIIGDVHGCYEELLQLIEKLGYEKEKKGLYFHPKGRKIVSLGDVMSRGPYSLKCLQFFYYHVENNIAYMIDSNHGWKIARWLDGRNVSLKHGDERVEEDFLQFEKEFGKEKTNRLKKQIHYLLLSSPSHYIFKKKGLQTVVCTHGGIRDDFIGKQSKRISDFCRYGDTAGFDETGRPIRLDWFSNHKTDELIIWGHDPKRKPYEINNTINIDQGVVFGGSLTAFRYPEKEFVSVKAKENYSGLEDTPITRSKI